MRSQKLYFDNPRGHRLAAVLDRPVDGKPGAYALYAHCFTCTKNLKAIYHLSRALTQRHIAVLRFDFTGLGESGGDFTATNFTTTVEDIICAARFLEHEFAGPALLIGHSLGGTAALAAAASIPSSKAVATIASPSEPVHVADHFAAGRGAIMQEGGVEIAIGGKNYLITKQFLEDLEAHRIGDAIRRLGKALLILHSPHDDTVGIENAARLFDTARHPKSFVSLDRIDHLMSREEDARYVGALIATWAAKYLDLGAPQMRPVAGVPGEVVVRTAREHYYTEIDAGGHCLIADEPVGLGGGNLGVNPYELLNAALGSCTGITLRMYADRHGWPLEEVNVRLRHEKIHADDCRDCPDAHPMIDRIDREIELSGDLSQAQRARLLEIADKCPVHRTLHGSVRVITRLKPS